MREYHHFEYLGHAKRVKMSLLKRPFLQPFTKGHLFRLGRYQNGGQGKHRVMRIFTKYRDDFIRIHIACNDKEAIVGCTAR